MECIVIHYSEIGLKGKNRHVFEGKLADNIADSLGKNCKGIDKIYGRLVVKLRKGAAEKRISGKLGKIPGISSFSFSLSCGRDIESMKKAIDSFAKNRKAKTFSIDSSRSYKAYEHTSREVNEILGDHVRKKYGWKVDLTNPDVTFSVEITEKGAYAYTGKHKGMGGLPVGSSGRLVSLISGGIDSPVAAHEMFRRGCEVVFVHFHNRTSQKDFVKDKVGKIVRVLSVYQPRTRLYMVPFGELQREITMKVPAKQRMIIYRRLMFSIAERIAAREKALGFVTGDSIGQVASQTLENLNSIYDSAKLPVFSPLIALNKEDIQRKAKEIGTYDLSILPYPDCCSFLIAKHPETRSKLSEIIEIENHTDTEKLISDAIAKAEKTKF